MRLDKVEKRTMEFVHDMFKSMLTSEPKKSSDPLPPCRVCDGTGSGIHYGVTTCNACKAFFHRSLRIYAKYTCAERDNKCQVQHGMAKLCQSCRYQKCLAVGLSTGAIKKGRYTLERKNKIILASSKSKKKKSTQCKSMRLPQNDIQREKCDEVNENQQSSQEPIEKNCIHSALSEPGIRHTSEGHSENILQRFIDQDEQDEQDSMLPFTPPSLIVSQSPESQDNLYLQSPFILNSDSMIEPSELDTCPLFSLPVFQDSNSSSSNLVHNIEIEPATFPHSLDVKDSVNMTPNELTSFNTSSTIEEPNKELLNRFSFSSESDNEIGYVKQLFSNKDAVLKALIEAHETDLRERFKSPEDALREAHEHYEKVKLQGELFGHLSYLSNEEYDDIFEETGLDADGRREKFANFITCLEEGFDRMLQFVKVVPGFSALQHDEKVKVLKYGRLEFGLLCNYVYAQVELGVVRRNNSTWWCLLEVGPTDLFEALKEYCHMCSKLQSLELSMEEQVLLKAMSAMAPDRGKTSSSPFIHQIYWNLAQLLILQLEKRRNHPLLVFAKIIDILTNFRVVEAQFTEVFRKSHIQKYCHVDDKSPLLKEIFTDFYVTASALE